MGGRSVSFCMDSVRGVFAAKNRPGVGGNGGARFKWAFIGDVLGGVL